MCIPIPGSKSVGDLPFEVGVRYLKGGTALTSLEAPVTLNPKPRVRRFIGLGPENQDNEPDPGSMHVLRPIGGVLIWSCDGCKMLTAVHARLK